MAKHRYNLIRFDTGTAGTSYKLFVRSLYDYVIVKEVTTSDVTERSYFVAAKDLETSWTNRASLTYSIDIRGRKLVNEGQNWLAAAGRTFTGLLDTYGGATAAYSLQLLSTDYSGNCVTVRRASDNATLDVGFSNNELDIASLETFCSSTNGFITTWYDQSGNGKNATQTTAANQPQIVSSGSVILENGKPAIYYDGTISKSLDVIFDTTLTQPNTYFIVANKNDITGFLFDGISGQRNAQENINMFAGVTLVNAYPISNQNTQVLFTALFDGASSQGFINGSNTTTGNTDTRGVAGLRIGNKVTQDDALEGTLQSFVFYNLDQSSNRTGIETALNDYYNIF